MKNLFLFVIFILALVLVQFAQAQTADEIIDKHLGARGGKDALKSIRSIIMVGNKQMMGTDVTIRVTKVNEKLSRTDFEIAGTPGYMIITPTEGWNFIPMRSTKPDELEEEKVKSMQGELDIAGPLVDYISKGHKVEMLGKEMINDIQNFKIKVTLNNGKEVIHFIDSKTFLLTQTVTTLKNPKGQKTEQVTEFSDWKAVGNIMFPHSINIQGSGMGAGITTFDKISLNEEINERFYKPE